ncbi:MAG: TonB-dependent receptor [Verrucomicrobiaceae bacterium]|nr:MAG: TonB-dependent receptor [Verrucomicrobiaceae bacterium]
MDDDLATCETAISLRTTHYKATRRVDVILRLAIEPRSRDRFFGNVGATFDVNNWLKLTTRVNADYYNFQFQDRIAVYSRSQSQYQEYNNTFSEFNYEFIASANKTWGLLSLNALAGGNILDRNTRISDATTQGGLIIPEYYNLKNASSVLLQSNKYHKRINSIFASASLGWNNLVYLDGTIRNDWSSTLPSNKNSFAYPSVTGSLILSQLGALKDIAWLDFAKLRLGWAQVGNDTEPYQLQNAYESQQPFTSLPSYQLPASLKNKELKPEISSSWETGINLVTLKNRLSLDVTYYSTRSRNQILNTPVSGAFGYTSKFINAGLITNRGVEVVLSGTPVKTKDFEWNASARAVY